MLCNSVALLKLFSSHAYLEASRLFDGNNFNFFANIFQLLSLTLSLAEYQVHIKCKLRSALQVVCNRLELGLFKSFLERLQSFSVPKFNRNILQKVEYSFSKLFV